MIFHYQQGSKIKSELTGENCSVILVVFNNL